MRLFCLPLLVMAICLGACATRQYSRNAYTAQGKAPITVDKLHPIALARREAIQLAQVRARDQLMAQILKMKMADGQTVEEAAVKDSYVQACVQDAVRAGHEMPNSRVVTEHDVQLTMYMDVAPIQKLLREYPARKR